MPVSIELFSQYTSVYKGEDYYGGFRLSDGSIISILMDGHGNLPKHPKPRPTDLLAEVAFNVIESFAMDNVAQLSRADVHELQEAFRMLIIQINDGYRQRILDTYQGSFLDADGVPYYKNRNLVRGGSTLTIAHLATDEYDRCIITVFNLGDSGFYMETSDGEYKKLSVNDEMEDPAVAKRIVNTGNGYVKVYKSGEPLVYEYNSGIKYDRNGDGSLKAYMTNGSNISLANPGGIGDLFAINLGLNTIPHVTRYVYTVENAYDGILLFDQMSDGFGDALLNNRFRSGRSTATGFTDEEIFTKEVYEHFGISDDSTKLTFMVRFWQM